MSDHSIQHPESEFVRFGKLLEGNAETLAIKWSELTDETDERPSLMTERVAIIRTLARDLRTGTSTLEILAEEYGRQWCRTGRELRRMVADLFRLRELIVELSMIGGYPFDRSVDRVLTPLMERIAGATCQSFVSESRVIDRRRSDSRTAQAERAANTTRKLALAVTRAEQRERRRNAQIVHDHLQQLLAAARLQLGHIEAITGPEETTMVVSRVDNILEESICVCRNLAIELIPPVLYESNLADSLRWLASWSEQKHGLAVSLDVDVNADPLEEEIRVYVYQSVRELLFNVVKHSGEKTAWLRLAATDSQWLEVTVRDEGQGFDLPATQDRFGVDSFGISSIRERLRMLGGHLVIQTSPGRGTTVTVTTPLSVSNNFPTTEG